MSEETVKDHYMQKGRCKISLNDQLDDFYEGCKNNTIGDECAYYFHAKRLDPTELAKRLKTYKKFCSKHMTTEGGIKIPKWLLSWIEKERINYWDTDTNNFSKRYQIVLILADRSVVTKNPFENMENNEYLFWNCFRITLTFEPQYALSVKASQLDF